MLSLTAETRIFVAAGATDMRKGFDGLMGVVSGVLEQDPLSGHLFLFVNRRRDKLKILYWDRDGLAIVHFDRTAESLEEAIRSAVANVQAAGCTIEHLEIDADAEIMQV